VRPDERDFATLCGFAALIAHSLKNHVDILVPYLVHYVQGQMHSLWTPRLAGPFEEIISANSATAEHNRKLWNEFHAVGRLRTGNASIWKKLLESDAAGVDEPKVEGATVVLSDEDGAASEFNVGRQQANAYLLKIPQEGDHLVAVCSIVPKEGCESIVQNTADGIANALRGFRFFNVAHDNIRVSSICAAEWAVLRRVSCNHGGDAEENFNSFCQMAEVNPVVAKVLADYPDWATARISRDGAVGLPPLKDLLSSDTRSGRIVEVLKRRIGATHFLGVPYSIVATSSPSGRIVHDYLWFNGIVLADFMSQLLASYATLLEKPAMSRVYYSKESASHKGVMFWLHETQRDQSVSLRVTAVEEGLEATSLEVTNTGTDSSRFLSKAFDCGASAVHFQLPQHRETWIAKRVEKGQPTTFTNAEIQDPLLPSLWFELCGKKSDCGYIVTT
jgi:hypothetical protein